MGEERAEERPTAAGELRTLVTCEHGGCRVPAERANLFLDRDELLYSHRGWDQGALELAHRVARRLAAPLFAAETTRLLVDLNRSPDHPEVFSELTRDLPAADREALLARHYYPYRHGVETAVAAAVTEGRLAIHLSIHSFTPVWEGRPRQVDVGLLFDPDRAWEVVLARRLSTEIGRRLPGLAVRDNEPYLGVADGFIPFLRRRFGGASYVGVEVEVNQRLVAGGDRVAGDATRWNEIRFALAESMAAALSAFPPASGGAV